EHLLLHRKTLAVLDLDLLLGRHEDLEDLVLHVQRGDAVLEVRLDLVLVAGIGVDDVPPPLALLRHGGRRRRFDRWLGNGRRLGHGDAAVGWSLRRDGAAEEGLGLLFRDLVFPLRRRLPEERARGGGDLFIAEAAVPAALFGGGRRRSQILGALLGTLLFWRVLLGPLFDRSLVAHVRCSTIGLVIAAVKRLSKAKMYTPTSAEITSTMIVRRITVSGVGQLTFFNSDQDSSAKRKIPICAAIVFPFSRARQAGL